jgi:transposase InsO family protein
LCRALRVSRSGYYAFTRRTPSRREQENKTLALRIRLAHDQSGRTYGSPRVWQELTARGVRCSESRIARLMRREGIRVTPVRRVRVTTDSAQWQLQRTLCR